MIDYVGDLSRRDAELLCALAKRAERILEFGAGASTQIFAAYGRGGICCVETDPAWIVKTRRNLARLEIEHRVAFHRFDAFRLSGSYDLVFVDGVDELRAHFAFLAWPALTVGGAMCFHDTRRTVPHGFSKTTDIQNALAVVERHSPEVDRMVLNQDDSNITVVVKRAPLLVEDWNVVERRTPKQIGLEP